MIGARRLLDDVAIKEALKCVLIWILLISFQMGMVTKWVRLPTAWVEAASLVVCHSLPPRPTPTELYQQTQAATKSWQQYLQGEHQAWQGECIFCLANTIFFHFFPKTILGGCDCVCAI